jgi:hypothetical protein
MLLLLLLLRPAAGALRWLRLLLRLWKMTQR